MDMSPPASPGKYSLNSQNLTVQQYFLVNLSKCLVELIGTAVLGIFYLLIGDQQVGMLLGIWVLTLFGEAISGAHYNPAITVVFMLRKNSKTFGSRRLKGIFYIVAQFLGGLAAGLLARFLLKGENMNIAPQPMISTDTETLKVSYRVTASMISEFVGSFVFIFLFMLCTDKKTQFSEDKVVNCFIMSSAYISARLMAGGCFVAHIVGSTSVYNEALDQTFSVPVLNLVGPLLNPALAFGQIVFAWTWSWWYIYPLMPFFGSAAALVFYEYVFVKSQEYLNDEDSEGSEGLSLASDTEKLNKEIQKKNDAQEAQTLEDDD